MRRLNTSVVLLFGTLQEALLYPYPLHVNETAVIQGDNTRYKRGLGVANSGDGLAKTFANLPWINNSAGVESSFAANVTATLTSAQLALRYITSTSVAGVSLTLPTAALLATQLSAKASSEFSFTVDNLNGANAVTLVVGTGITAATPALTGGASLVVAAGSIGKFAIYFKSPTVAIIFRVL